MPNDISARAGGRAAPDWAEVRKEFPTTAKLTFLNSGMKVILPRCVARAMQEWIDDVYDTAGETAFAMAEIERARTAVAQAFGAPKEDISLIKNTSEGVSIIAQGFPWREGDNVVISDIEHENNTFPWRYLEARGVETRFAKPDPQGRVTLDCYRPLVDKRTRILALAWVAYGNGYRADLPELAAFCGPRGVKLIVDGIQGVGVLATPISTLGVDAMIAGGHKAQLSLTGAGLMYVHHARVAEHTHAAIRGKVLVHVQRPFPAASRACEGRSSLRVRQPQLPRLLRAAPLRRIRARHRPRAHRGAHPGPYHPADRRRRRTSDPRAHAAALGRARRPRQLRARQARNADGRGPQEDGHHREREGWLRARRRPLLQRRK
jgi:selenocysteine lyase/cysteine desulfurase